MYCCELRGQAAYRAASPTRAGEIERRVDATVEHASGGQRFLLRSQEGRDPCWKGRWPWGISLARRSKPKCCKPWPTMTAYVNSIHAGRRLFFMTRGRWRFTKRTMYSPFSSLIVLLYCSPLRINSCDIYGVAICGGGGRNLKVFGSALRRNAGEVYIPDGCIIVHSVAPIWVPHLRLGNHQDLRSKPDPPTLLGLIEHSINGRCICLVPPLLFRARPRGCDGQRVAVSDAVGRRPGYVEPGRPVYVIAFNLSVTHVMSVSVCFLL